jgi:ATP-dependent RNA helicase DOB1
VKKALDEVAKRFPDGLALLDPIENMGIKDDSFKKLLRVSPACPYFYYLS